MQYTRNHASNDHYTTATPIISYPTRFPLLILQNVYYFKQAHLEACPFKIVTCTNENCHVTLKRKDLEQHVTNTCDWKILKCEYCKEPHPERCLKVKRIENNKTTLSTTSRILNEASFCRSFYS